MDHWGDPWSDNANDASVTKTEVTSPLPSAQTSAPVLLNGFLDDAGWGSEDASFGDWATTPEATVPAARTPHALTDDTDTPRGHVLSQDGAQWSVEEHSSPVLPIEGDDWHQDLQDEACIDSVPSEASDSATTVQQENGPDDTTTESPGQLQPDDDSSARPSTSLSGRSHNEPPAESPRTSIEEDRGAIKPLDHGLDVPNQYIVESRQEANEEPGSVKEDMPEEAVSSLNRDNSNNASQAEDMHGFGNEPGGLPSPKPSGLKENKPSDFEPLANDPAVVNRTPKHNPLPVDTTLLDKLFPPPEESHEQDEAPDDPIYSTGGRKAWYRLTRRQTLREYNSGNADDNYIRVTWANSEIRKEVNKTVGRWAREDRLSGTGPGARASFYWDTSAPPEPKIQLGHTRTKTSVPTPRAVVPARQSLPPLTTDAPAAFNWSSAAAADPWGLDSPALRSTSSPLAARPVTSDNIGQDSQAVSQKIASPDSGMGEQVSNRPSETSGVASPIASYPTTPALPAFREHWNNFSSIDTNVATKDDAAAAAVDDDDEWGEMVGSPTLAEPETRNSISQATLLSDVIPALPATPPPSRSFSAQKQSADAMHASHITRLKGTISPTSAIFKTKSFVPLGAEQGPIGPGILKPVKRPEPFSLDSEPTKPLSAPPTDVNVKHKPHSKRTDPVGNKTVNIPHLDPAFAPAEANAIPAIPSSSPAPPPEKPKTPPPSTTPQPTDQDAWANADLSFFESTSPAPLLRTQPTKPSASPGIPVFGTPTRSARSSSAASSSKSYTRSPPRTSPPPPPVQPLTGATNAAQRRKDEEERTIREILAGLPDLGYMLR
ncbi:hypothetical protein J1614_000878 [Plenodomus biglobosus]|nr:hypothetical protein J1614_000878 [Plenodomus biglobosus]